LRIYADASFLVSLYCPDANSAAALHLMKSSAAERLVSTLGELETVNALGLRLFRREITAAQAKASLQAWDQDLRDGAFLIRPLSEDILARARELSVQTTAKLGARGADLLHVSAAVELKANVLYTFDQHQRKLAQYLRLKVN